ncbi:MAG: regulatory signaling modulator protein AmpE [Gammaproteobacteria bacterium]|nr:regulatory signaling modulator protein AmpE [Gammaproteobacteria bacterium]
MFEVVCAVLLAVALDRFVPEHFRVDPFMWVRAMGEFVAQRFDGDSRAHGTIALVIVVVVVLIVIVILHFVLGLIAWIFQFAFDVIVLFWCVGLHRLGQRAEDVVDALQAGEIPVANEKLRTLSGQLSDDLSEPSIAHDTVVAVLKQGNSNVIAPLFWFALLGPFGAILQRMTGALSRLWAGDAERAVGFGWATVHLSNLLDWAPARVTALSYAAVGSFEDALRCWRDAGDVWSDSADVPLLAAGLGAMQMKNCEVAAGGDDDEALDLVTADTTHVQRALALVWRALLFWLLLVFLLLVFSLVAS